MGAVPALSTTIYNAAIQISIGDSSFHETLDEVAKIDDAISGSSNVMGEGKTLALIGNYCYLTWY